MVWKSSFTLNFDRFRHVDFDYDIVKSDLVIDSGFPKKIFDLHGVVIGDNKGLITCGR